MLRYSDVIQYKVLAELRAEMDRAYFGLVWWILEPILFMAVFYIVFAMLFHRGGEGFVPFLLCGLVSWRWFDASVRTSSQSIIANAALMSQVHVPKIVFPVVTVLANTLKFFVILTILVIFFLFYGIEPVISWLALPVVIATQFVVVLAFAILVALVVPFFPDLKILISNAMTAMLFVSGIFFSIREQSQVAQDWLYLNPRAVIIEAYRDLFIGAAWPDWYRMGGTLLSSVAVLVVALLLARRFDRVYPKIVA